MNPPSPPASSKLARFMKREHCVWVASPGLAFLSVVAGATKRPTRFLSLEGAPPFADDVAKMLGIPTSMIPEAEAREALQAALRNAGSRPDVPWGIATYRGGRAAQSEPLAALTSLVSPTIEFCLGGLFAIDRPSQATVTIASLDSEAAFEGVHLCALLTDSAAIADEVRRRTQPDPASAQGVDFGPRGLSQDEAGLAVLIDRAIERAEAAEKERKKQAPPSFSLTWKRLFEEPADPGVAPPSLNVVPNPPVSRPAGENPWLARLAAAEERRLEAMRASASELARYREQLEEHQALAAQWERRAESAAAAAAASDKARASLLNEKAQLEERLAAGLSMSEELGNRLRQIEAELRQQISDATAREAALKAEAEEQKDAHQRTIAGLLARIEDLDKQRDRDTVSREAALRHAVQTQDGLKARIEQLERELSAVQIESRSAHEQLGDAASSHRRDLEASEALVAESRQALADSQAARAAEQNAHAKAIEAAEDRRRILEEDLARARETLRVQTQEGEAVRAALEARAQELERALSQAREDREREQSRAVEAVEAHRAAIQAVATAREALAAFEAGRAAEQASHLKSSQAAETGRTVLEERAAELKETLRVQTKEGEAARAALNARVQELERALSQAREDREREQSRAVEAVETHRAAIQAAEAKLATAREALAASEASRAAEQTSHLKSAQAAETGRALLEERVADLKETLRAQAKEGEAARAALNSRVQELERSLSQGREDREREQARAVEAVESHRAAIQATEAKLAAAREALAASEASRAAEQTSHAKSSQASEAGRAVLEERVAELKEALRVQAKEGEASRTALNARAQELEQALSQAREDRDRAQARGVTAADRLAETREELASLKSARAATEKPDPRFPDLEPIQTLLGERARSTLGHRRRARNHPGTSTAGDLEQPLAESSSDEVGTASRTTGPIADSASLVKEEWMAQPPVWEARSARLSGPLEREASPPHDPADPSFEPEYDGRRAAEEPDAAPQGSWLRGLAQRIRGG